MKHLGTETLETERLILRKINLNDVENAFENWMNDSEVTKYLRWKSHKSIEESEEVIGKWEADYKNKDKDTYRWCIVFKEINEPIGMIDTVSIDETSNKIEIGYSMGREWWYRGIMAEAFSRIIKFLFEEVEVNRIEAKYDPKNEGSGVVMKKCGLKFEGTLRQFEFTNQGIVDMNCYSILADDYFGK